jgi:hypothetical protein
MSDIPDNGAFSLGLANITSQNYGPTAVANQGLAGAQTQLAGANTQNVQQQAQTAAMQNKLMAARMPLILSQLHDESIGAGDSSGVGGEADSKGSPVGGASAGSGGNVGGSQRTPGEDVASEDESAVGPGQNFYQPDKIDAALRAKYFVPQYTPQEMQALKRAYLVDPQDQYGMGPKRVMAMHDMRIQQSTQQNQLDSRNDFDKLSAVTDAPAGNAMDVLEASHPDTVAAIRRQFAKEPDSEMAQDEDAAARMFASHAAGAVHQYTGRKAVKDDAGVYRDEDTGIPIPGVEKVGLSTDQYTKLAHESITPSVKMDDGNGGSILVAPWKAAQMGGAKNINGPGDWMMVRASQQGLPGAASTLSPNSAPKQAAHAVAQTALDKARAADAAAPAPTSGAPAPANGVGTARNAQGNIDPQLTDALHDTKYSYKPTNNGETYTPQIGHTPPPAVLDDMKNQTNARNNLAKDSNQGVGASAAALTMYKAAQDVLAKGNYDGGAWNQELAKYSRWLPAGWQNHMTGDYQEVAKYLGGAALQAGKGIFSKMTEKESDTVMHDLNPSPGMDPTALRDMIARGAKTAQYSLDSSKRVPAYLHSGNDANQFNSWNQEHFPMETETKPTPTKPNAGVTAPKYNDAQVSAYMQKHGLTDLQATRKALGMQ